jgi:putative transposase
MKNRVLLENYYLPGDLERQIGTFVEYYNNQRYHESLNNVTPADVYFGRDKAILRERKKIKKLTIRQRRLQHQKQAAKSIIQTNQSLQCSSRSDVPFYMTTDMP